MMNVNVTDITGIPPTHKQYGISMQEIGLQNKPAISLWSRNDSKTP